MSKCGAHRGISVKVWCTQRDGISVKVWCTQRDKCQSVVHTEG